MNKPVPLLGIGGILLAGVAGDRPIDAIRVRSTPPVVQANPNTEAAGRLRNGVLTVTLEAKPSTWYLDGPRRRAMTIEAFSEPGKAPLVPGPFVRAPAGTELRLTVRNSLSRPLTFEVPAALHDAAVGAAAENSMVIAPGGVETLVTRADVPGNYMYRAETPLASGQVKPLSGLLAGAIVVDSAGSPARPDDRVFVIMATDDSSQSACIDTVAAKNPGRACAGERQHYTINGASWPATERVRATVGDSLRWRVINASGLPHPMHLHGFYYRVNSYTGNELAGGARNPDRPLPGQMVVTQLVAPWSAMSMTWSPDRPGNWLFHCHTAMHTTPPDSLSAPDNEDMHGMAGLVLGTIVAPRAGAAVVREPPPVRRLRLVAEQAAGAEARGGPWNAARGDSVPLMHFVLEEHGRRSDTHTDVSPEIDLVRGEPVAITVVNHLHAATTVHWHGIELRDSYMDGTAGFGGMGAHLAPAIAPGDSFVARFTPPRSGTFMYHAHVDDLPEQMGGLEGPLIVRDRGAPSGDDHSFFFQGLTVSKKHPAEINGQTSPDTVVLHVGRAARLRFMNLSINVPSPTFFLTTRTDRVSELARDTMLVRWRVVAKDGFDLPAGVRAPRPAQQVVGMGETWDVEFTPSRRGTLDLEARDSGPQHHLFVRVPIRAE